MEAKKQVKSGTDLTGAVHAQPEVSEYEQVNVLAILGLVEPLEGDMLTKTGVAAKTTDEVRKKNRAVKTALEIRYIELFPILILSVYLVRLAVHG